MKLNYKRTIFVGFAFFLICAFWQAYDNTIPLILTNKFGLSQTASGVVMALDNILALFMLPLFGAISDKCRHRLGRRTPFILVGTIVAAVVFVGLTFADNMQLKQISKVSKINDPAGLVEIYQNEKDATLQTPDGKKYTLSELFTEEEFSAIPAQLVVSDGKVLTFDFREIYGDSVGFVNGDPYGDEYDIQSLVQKGIMSEEEAASASARKADKEFTNPVYTNYVVPARQAYAWNVTKNSTAPLIFFMILLLIVLVSMSTFRSPAVALMPDVTIKPLRSKANAIINLMGSAGGILVLGLGMVFATSAVRNSLLSYSLYFGVIAAIMLLALLIFMLKVKETKFVKEMEAESERYGIDNGATDETTGSRKLG